MEKLLSLINYSDVLKSPDQIETKVFNKSKSISKHIFLNYCIYSNITKECFDITSLEFYLYRNKIFEDDATHGGLNQISNHPQLSSENFYVHSQKNIKNYDLENPSFQIPNRFGIDITCGSNKNNVYYGGILIKGIDNIKGSKSLLQLIRGRKSYDELLKKENNNTAWKPEEKEILKKINMSKIFDCNNPIYLKEKKGEKINLYSSQRVGIEKTKYKDLELSFSICNKNCSQHCT